MEAQEVATKPEGQGNDMAVSSNLTMICIARAIACVKTICDVTAIYSFNSNDLILTSAAPTRGGYGRA